LKLKFSGGFANLSTIFFTDQLLVSFGNWLYWLAVSRLTTSSEIGEATVVISLVLLINSLAQLGLEYPLLKKSSIDKSRIVGTVITIELLITLVSLPLVYFVLFEQSLQEFFWIAVVILLISGIAFVPRFALFGNSKAKSVLIIDVASTVLKFVIAYILVSFGLGANGMLLSILAQILFVAVASLIVLSRSNFRFHLGDVNYFKKIVADGVANFPSKLSRVLILSISVVLLGLFGVSSSEIGIYYVALVIGMIGASVSASMAFMVIPASLASKEELLSDSMRLGLSFSAPIIAALIVAPKFILSLFGVEYASGYALLIILSLAIFPSCIVLNTITKLNYANKQKALLAIGSTEVISFFIAFFFLVPLNGLIGAAVSVLIAFTVSSIISAIMWSQRELTKYIIRSGIATFIGILTGYTAGLLFELPPVILIIVSAGTSLALVIKLKNTSLNEIMQFVSSILKST
jgi:O-antigen/teichoic acid export membrane protein